MRLWPDIQDVDAHVASELQDEERIVWRGQPIPGMIIKREIGGMVIGAILFAACLAGAISLVCGLLQSDDLETTVLVVGFLFMNAVIGLGPGLLLLLSPYWSWRNAKRTHYVLTNQRAILFQASWLHTLKTYSFEPPQLANLARVQFADGTGHIMFTPLLVDSDAYHNVKRPIPAGLGFIGVRDVKRVAEAIDELVASGISGLAGR